MTAAARAVFVLVMTVVPILGFAGVAAAHTELVESRPAAGSSTDRAVTGITLIFASPVAPELAGVVVAGGDGADRVVGGPDVQGTMVTVPVRPLDVAGGYTVSYRVVAIDGHPISGSYSLTVSEAGARDARSVSAQLGTATGATESVPANLPVTGTSWKDLAPELGVVLLALLIFAAAMVRRSRVLRPEVTDG